jgi:hypothetical protein
MRKEGQKLKELASNFDIITEYVRKHGNEDGLTPTQREILMRANFADNIIMTHPHWKDKEVINDIMAKFGVSYYTAFYDLQNAKLLFGSKHFEHKPFWRHFIIEQAREGIERALTKNKPDLKAHYEYLKLIAGITQLYNEDSNLLTAALMRPADNYIMVNVNEKHLHLHLDKLEEMDEEVVESIRKSVIDQSEMPEITLTDGERKEDSEG